MPKKSLGITRRERQLLDCLLSEWSPREICEELNYSNENTYYIALSRLKRKLQIHESWVRFHAADWNYLLLRSYVSCVIKIKKSPEGALVLRTIPDISPGGTPIPPEIN